MHGIEVVHENSMTSWKPQVLFERVMTSKSFDSVCRLSHLYHYGNN
jgi:hypothetical protein